MIHVSCLDLKKRRCLKVKQHRAQDTISTVHNAQFHVCRPFDNFPNCVLATASVILLGSDARGMENFLYISWQRILLTLALMNQTVPVLLVLADI